MGMSRPTESAHFASRTGNPSHPTIPTHQRTQMVSVAVAQAVGVDASSSREEAHAAARALLTQALQAQSQQPGRDPPMCVFVRVAMRGIGKDVVPPASQLTNRSVDQCMHTASAPASSCWGCARWRGWRRRPRKGSGGGSAIRCSQVRVRACANQSNENNPLSTVCVCHSNAPTPTNNPQQRPDPRSASWRCAGWWRPRRPRSQRPTTARRTAPCSSRPAPRPSRGR